MQKETKKQKNKKVTAKEKFNIPTKSAVPVKESIIKLLAQDLLCEIPKYDTRFILVRAILEGMADEGFEFTKEQVRQSVYKIKNKGYVKQKTINSTEDSKIIKFQLTKKGERLLQGYEFNNLAVKPMKKWDGKWRFIIFDILEKSRYVRDIFRDKLKNMGFFMLQQSVWIYPYECKNEIDFILEFLGIRNSVLIFEVEIERDDLLKKYFKKELQQRGHSSKT